MYNSYCKGLILDQVRIITFTLKAVFLQLITFRTRTFITSFGIYTSLTATMEFFSWITFIDVYSEIEKIIT